MCLFTLHSSIIDFRFYAPSTNVAKKTSNLHVPSDDEEDSMTFIENGILVEKKQLEKSTEEEGTPRKGPKKK
jgi:hypothetical protein